MFKKNKDSNTPQLVETCVSLSGMLWHVSWHLTESVRTNCKYSTMHIFQLLMAIILPTFYAGHNFPYLYRPLDCWNVIFLSILQILSRADSKVFCWRMLLAVYNLLGGRQNWGMFLAHSSNHPWLLTFEKRKKTLQWIVTKRYKMELFYKHHCCISVFQRNYFTVIQIHHSTFVQNVVMILYC